MLSAQAAAVTAEPDGRSASEVSLDARVRRCRVGTTGNRGPFRRHTGLIVPFGDGHQGYSTPKSTSASYLSGECRFKATREFSGFRRGAWLSCQNSVRMRAGLRAATRSTPTVTLPHL